MDDKTWFLDDPKNVKRLLWVFYAICAGLLITDLFFHRHVTHPWERLFGFYSFYGLGACVALVLIAKQMRKVVMRDEDYYEPESETEEDRVERQSGHGI